MTLAQRLRQEIPNYANLSPFDRTVRIRDWVYAHSNVAAEEAQLLPHETLTTQSVDQNFKDMDDHKGGYWCWGIAFLLMQAYQAAGYESWQVDCGDPGSLTHCITLVKIDGTFFAQDAYFNFHYLDDQRRPLSYFAMLGQLSRKFPLAVDLGQSRLRKVICDKNPDTTNPWYQWVAPQTPPGSPSQFAGNRCIYQVDTSAERLISCWSRMDFLIPNAYKFLESRHLPPNVQFLLLFPMSTFGPQGWTNDPARSEVLRQSREYTPTGD